MERLYNGIILPDAWPPKRKETSLDKVLDVPYLTNKPDNIDISIGRQLFVDDFLICKTDLTRKYGTPRKTDKAIFKPETQLEKNNGYCTCACPFNGGVFYDSMEKKYKMWYHAGWFDGSAYAESEDGFSWNRLSELYENYKSDRILPHIPGYLRDGDAVWIDENTSNEDERYKMLCFYRCFDTDFRYYHLKPKHAHDDPLSIPPKEITVLYKSKDGINWKMVKEVGPFGDNTTFFYNPFRKKWVYSLRTFSELDSRVRVRGYYETDNFYDLENFKTDDVVFWTRTDIFDKPDPELGYYTQLYNMDAVAYESIMLGIYSVFMGPPNFVCEKTGMPKINDLKLAYSRDGFHFSRGNHSDFISSSRKSGSWDYGYLHSANGICTVTADEIYFYYSAFSGQSPKFKTHKYSGGAMGIATLRRDGFAYLTDNGQGGYILTEKLLYSGAYLFLNVDSSNGMVKAELLDENGNVIPGYDADSCIAISINSTKYAVKWLKHERIDVGNKIIRIRFILNNSSLYSFWITDCKEGKSHGYLAAGSPIANKSVRDE